MATFVTSVPINMSRGLNVLDSPDTFNGLVGLQPHDSGPIQLVLSFGTGNLTFDANVEYSFTGIGPYFIDSSVSFTHIGFSGPSASWDLTDPPFTATVDATLAGDFNSGDFSVNIPNLVSVSFHEDNLLTGTPTISNMVQEPTNTYPTVGQWLLSGDDVFTGSSGKDTLFGYNGSDSMSGGGGADMINGGAGNDVLSGEAGADQLLGGAGADMMSGDANNDTLTGGGGGDEFIFAGPLKNNIDTIMDFTHGPDKIVLDDAIFAKFAARGSVAAGNLHIGAHAVDNNDFLNYNPTTGELTYDANGNTAGGNPLVFAVLDNHATLVPLVASDFIIG